MTIMFGIIDLESTGPRSRLEGHPLFRDHQKKIPPRALIPLSPYDRHPRLAWWLAFYRDGRRVSTPYFVHLKKTRRVGMAGTAWSLGFAHLFGGGAIPVRASAARVTKVLWRGSQGRFLDSLPPWGNLGPSQTVPLTSSSDRFC
ncbi:hypothetical protein LX36DRAFT_659870 [Colletotrichum falcatum]|nr:hypothetical protein LX36DRAFT_659870 [Colletotrichum falcatum]